MSGIIGRDKFHTHGPWVVVEDADHDTFVFKAKFVGDMSITSEDGLSISIDGGSTLIINLPQCQAEKLIAMIMAHPDNRTSMEDTGPAVRPA